MSKEKKSKKHSLDKVTQDMFIVKLIDPNDLMLLKCSCGGNHFRHAGYVEQMTPYASLQSGKDPIAKVAVSSLPVKVCVNCKKSYVETDGKIYDITHHIDLEAWEKSEVELNTVTGPGGEC